MKKITTILFAMLVFIVAMAAVACKSNITIKIDDGNKPRDVYVLGQDLDLSVGRIAVTEGNKETYYENLSSPEVSVSGYEKDRLGAKELTVSYKGATTSYIVNVYDAIEVTGAKLDYFINEPFDYSQGEVTFTDSADGSRSTITFKDLEMSGFDSSTAGEKSVVLKYGGQETILKVNVWEIDGDASEFVAPTEKTKYMSHETEINLVGGYIMAKNTTGTIKRPVELKDATVSGFNPAAATPENTEANPLKQTISVTFAKKTWTYTIDVVFSKVSEFKNVAAKYIAKNYSYLEIDAESGLTVNDLTAEEQEEVFDAMDLFFTFTEDDFGFITSEEKLAVAVPASLYGHDNYNKVFGEFIPLQSAEAEKDKAFSYIRISDGREIHTVITFSAPEYATAKKAYDTLSNRDDEDIKSMLKYNKLVVECATHPELMNLTLSQEVMDYLGRKNPITLGNCLTSILYVVDLQEFLYDGTDTNPGVLEVINHMLTFYNGFEGIDLSTMNTPENKARLDDLYEDLVSSPAGGDYNLIAKWTKADKTNPKDIVFILFKHLYDKAAAENFDATKDSFKNWVKMGDFVVPADFEEVYSSALNAWNYGYDQVKYYKDIYGALYENVSTTFQSYLHKTNKLIKSFESLDDPYKTVYLKTFDVYKIKFFNTDDESKNYYTINDFMDAVNALNVTYFGAMYKNTELEALNELYVEMVGMALDNTYSTGKNDEYGNPILTEEFKKAAHDFFKAFVEASASVQYNFLLTYSNENKLLLQFKSTQDNSEYQNTVIGNVLAIYFYSDVMANISEEKDPEDNTIPSEKELAIDVFNYYLNALESFVRREISDSSYGVGEFISNRKAAKDLIVQTGADVQNMFANNELLKALVDKVDEYFALTEAGKLKTFEAPANKETEFASLTSAMSAAAIVLEWASVNNAYGAYFAAYERVAGLYEALLADAASDTDLYNALQYGKVSITTVSGTNKVVPAIYMADLYSELIELMNRVGFYVDYKGELEYCYDVYFDDPKIRDYVRESADFIVDYVLLIEVSVNSNENVHFVTSRGLKDKVEAFMAKFYGTAQEDSMTADDRALFLSFYYDGNAFESALFYYYAEVFELDFTSLNTPALRAAHPVSKFAKLMVSYYPYKYWSSQPGVAESELKGFKDAYDEALAEYKKAYGAWTDATAKGKFDEKLGALATEFQTLAQA